MPRMEDATTALIVVDVQNDFLPGGSLAVPHGDEIIASVNGLIRSARTVILTADWHPPHHQSFAAEHSGAKPFETIRMPYGEQVLWPVHCVAGTIGAAFAPELETTQANLILRKGCNVACDSYSAFVEADGKTHTGLAGWLNERGVRDVVICGLAADFCVSATALDAAKEGFSVTVVTDAVRAIAEQSYQNALDDWRKVGIKTATVRELLNEKESTSI